MMKVSARQGQTIYDIAIKQYGDVSGIDWVLEDNPSLNVEDDIAGKDILLRKDVRNQVIVDRLVRKKLTTY